MATFQFGGIDNYIKQLNKLQQSTKDGVVGKTVYAGATVVADSVRRAIQALPVGDGRARNGGLVDTVTLPQKAGLLDGILKSLEEAASKPTWKTVWTAGQSVGLVDDILSVREIYAKLINEYDESVKNLSTLGLQ